MNFNNAISKTLMLLLATSALAACGDDEDKSKPDTDTNKPSANQDAETQKPVDLSPLAKKLVQPAASKVLSTENPAAKIAEGVDKDALAKAKAITVVTKGDELTYGDVTVNDPNKGIELKDDTLFKLVAAMGKSTVGGHGQSGPSPEIRYIYNTPYASVDMRYRQANIGGVEFGTFTALGINGLSTTSEQMSKLQKAGGKANFEGVAWFQKSPGVLGDAKLTYTIDLSKLEGSGKITGLDGMRDFQVDPKNFTGSKPQVGMWYPDVKEVELGAVSFAKTNESDVMGGQYTGGEGKIKFKGQTDKDKLAYVVGAFGPELNTVGGAITSPAHGKLKGVLPFIGMRSDVK